MQRVWVTRFSCSVAALVQDISMLLVIMITQDEFPLYSLVSRLKSLKGKECILYMFSILQLERNLYLIRDHVSWSVQPFEILHKECSYVHTTALWTMDTTCKICHIKLTVHKYSCNNYKITLSMHSMLIHTYHIVTTNSTL